MLTQGLLNECPTLMQNLVIIELICVKCLVLLSSCYLVSPGYIYSEHRDKCLAELKQFYPKTNAKKIG